MFVTKCKSNLNANCLAAIWIKKNCEIFCTFMQKRANHNNLISLINIVLIFFFNLSTSSKYNVFWLFVLMHMIVRNQHLIKVNTTYYSKIPYWMELKQNVAISLKLQNIHIFQSLINHQRTLSDTCLWFHSKIYIKRSFPIIHFPAFAREHKKKIYRS